MAIYVIRRCTFHVWGPIFLNPGGYFFRIVGLWVSEKNSWFIDVGKLMNTIQNSKEKEERQETRNEECLL